MPQAPHDDPLPTYRSDWEPAPWWFLALSVLLGATVLGVASLLVHPLLFPVVYLVLLLVSPPVDLRNVPTERRLAKRPLPRLLWYLVLPFHALVYAVVFAASALFHT